MNKSVNHISLLKESLSGATRMHIFSFPVSSASRVTQYTVSDQNLGNEASMCTELHTVTLYTC